MSRLQARTWLALIVLASFAIRALLAREVEAPTVMIDELVHSELAKSFADAGRFLVRDAPTDGYGLLYPVLVSPAYALFERAPEAYAAVKTINALLMSLAAVPAYLIARRVLPRTWALVAAALAVAVPSLVYTATVMTENAFYPLFLVAAWTLVVVLDAPTGWRTAGLMALVAFALAARPHAVVLLPAIATAPLLLSWLRRTSIRLYVPVYVGLACIVLAGAAAAAVRRRAPEELLGAYEVVADRSYDVGEVLRYWLWHLGELTLYVGVAPVAALIVLLALARRLSAPVQAFLAATVSLVLWLSLAVATFASEFAERLQERNLFHVAPLLFVALLVWAREGAPRPLRIALPAAAGAVALVLVVPYGRFLDDLGGDTLALLALERSPLGSLFWTAAFGAVLAAAAFLFLPERALPVLILAWLFAVNYATFAGPRGLMRASDQATSVAFGGVERDWIDRAVPKSEEVAAIWTGRSHPLTIFENEFFNRSVSRIYRTAGETPGGLAETPLTVAAGGTLRLADGSPLRARYLLVDDGAAIEPAGKAVARAPDAGLTLWRVEEPVRSLAQVDGLHEGSTWSGPTVMYTRRRCAGGTLAATLASDPALLNEPTTVVATSGGKRRQVRFAPAETVVLRLPLTPMSGRCTARFTVTPTTVPAEVVPGATDARRLGAHFRAFRLEP